MKLRGPPEQNESGEAQRHRGSPDHSRRAQGRTNPKPPKSEKDTEVQSLRLRRRIEGEGQVPGRGREGGGEMVG